MMIHQVSPNRQQLLPLRHINPRSDQHVCGTNLQIKPTTRSLLESIPRPPGRDMMLIRPLVLAESNVPIDPHQNLVRWPQMLRRKLRHRLIHLADQPEHRLLQLLLVNVLPLSKPLAVIVLLHPPQKLQSLIRKLRRHPSIVPAQSSPPKPPPSTPKTQKSKNKVRKVGVFFNAQNNAA